MTLDQIKKMEREKQLLKDSYKARSEARRAIRDAEVNQDLPGVRSSGLVRKMTEQERKDWFEKLRKESGV